MATLASGANGDVASALAYVREVRDRFATQSWRYEEFLRAMQAFKRGACVDDATRPRPGSDGGRTRD